MTLFATSFVSNNSNYLELKLNYESSVSAHCHKDVLLLKKPFIIYTLLYFFFYTSFTHDIYLHPQLTTSTHYLWKRVLPSQKGKLMDREKL